METCIIVGAGLTGLFLARDLSRSGIKVTVLERGKLGREASWAGGGILSPLYPWRYPAPVTALASWSQHRYKQLMVDIQAESGLDPEYVQSGLLIQTSTEQVEAQRWAQQHNLDMQSVSAADSLALEPSLGQAAEGLWLPSIGQVRNPRLLQALVKACVNLGVDFREDCRVEGILHADERASGVKTSMGEYLADSVVVAGGAWSQQILGSLGKNLQVEPVKGQMLLYKCAPGLVRRIVLADGHYIIPRRDGLILAGSTLEFAGFDKTPTDQACRKLQAMAKTLIPALADCPVIKHWAGLRPGSVDGTPSIGEYPELDGLYISAGHFRNGVTMGPASARLLTDLMLGREPIIDARPYAPKA